MSSEAFDEAGSSAPDVRALLEQHLPTLQAFLRAQVGPGGRGQEELEDLVQSVCREVLDHEDRFRFPGPEAFRRWLYREAMRKVASRHRYRRAQKRGGELADLGSDPGAIDKVLVAYQSLTTPSQAVGKAEQVSRIESALDELPEDQRRVVILAHLAQWSRKEIAEEMGRGEGAVRMLLHRALATLAARLA